MATNDMCPACGRLLAADAIAGLCPECLMKAGFGTGTAPPPGAATAPVAFTPPSTEELAKLFPQLEVVALLGQGGMGAVYKARQPALDRWVALKVLPPQTAAKPGFSERFSREARALARLSHPNIVAVHEFGQVGGLPYFIMEFVDGVSLRQVVQAGSLKPEQALAIVPQICDALQLAHDEGVVHRDIKPENILLDKKGRVKIADFGIAKIVGGNGPPSLLPHPPGTPSSPEAEGESLTRDQQLIGTPHYMAPEQVEAPHLVDHRADIYSLGVVFYEMLTGELPLGRFQPPSSRMPGIQVDVRLDEVVLKAMEKEPERRYQQASQVRTELETIVRPSLSAASSASRDRMVEPAINLRRRENLLWYGFIVSLIGLPIGIFMDLPIVWGLSICGIVLGAYQLHLLRLWSGEDQGSGAAAAAGGPFGRYQLGLLPNLRPGERVLHFRRRITATRWKSPPTRRFFLNLPLASEVGLYVTDLRAIVVSHAFRLLTHEFSIWFADTAQGAVCEILKGVSTGRSRWFGPYVDLISEYPEKRWYRSRELRLRLYLAQPEALERILVTASRAAQDAPGQLPTAAGEPRMTSEAVPRPIRWARDAARILSMLILLGAAAFVVTEGLPPFARQPGGVQLTSVGALLILQGLIIGWWREGTAAVLIGAGWTLVRASESEFRIATPLEIVPALALLYAFVWWGLQGRKTMVAGTVATALAVALILGRLLLPTNILIEGRITDAATGTPISYAELAVFNRTPSPDTQQVVPSVRALENGRFSLHVGWYAARKSVWAFAAGYETLKTNLGARPLGQRQLDRDYALRPLRSPVH